MTKTLKEPNENIASCAKQCPHLPGLMIMVNHLMEIFLAEGAKSPLLFIHGVILLSSDAIFSEPMSIPYAFGAV